MTAALMHSSYKVEFCFQAAAESVNWPCDQL